RRGLFLRHRLVNSVEIRPGLEEFYRTGMKPKEMELYKEDGFDTWEKYCRVRWDFSRVHAHRLITASEFRQQLNKRGAIRDACTGLSSRECHRAHGPPRIAPILKARGSSTEHSPREARGCLALVSLIRTYYSRLMSDVTQILNAIEQGDPHAAEHLLPLVYDELRKLAAAKMAQENPGQTLQATALVHEAYLRLVDGGHARQWDSRGHFFVAAAEAMRRILVEQARRKGSQKRGGGMRQVELDAELLLARSDDRAAEDLLAIDEALRQFESEEP